ncbi:basigin-like [Anneissia japonica]|uniref:basigin-like n=1 Tax=Anneissia japonica TaxID=1529436 RepID=UPI00142588D7|nr:basigin-like [Anneissia japonica]
MLTSRIILDFFLLICLFSVFVLGSSEEAPYLLMTPSGNQFIKNGKDINVECKVMNTTSPYDITWYKNNQPLQTQGHYIIQGNKFSIRSPGSKQVGTYSCEAIVETIDGSVMLERSITYGEPIHIEAMDTIRYSKGEIAHIVCTATSSPLPVVTWSINNMNVSVAIDSGNTSHYQQVGRNDGPHGWKSTLRVLDLSYSDTGVYNCTAFNGIHQEHKAIRVTVQDRMAAVYPFLGIVTECTILIIVILIQEKCSEDSYDECDALNKNDEKAELLEKGNLK